MTAAVISALYYSHTVALNQRFKVNIIDKSILRALRRPGRAFAKKKGKKSMLSKFKGLKTHCTGCFWSMPVKNPSHMPRNCCNTLTVCCHPFELFPCFDVPHRTFKLYYSRVQTVTDVAYSERGRRRVCEACITAWSQRKTCQFVSL